MRAIVDGLLYDTDKSELVHIDSITKRRLYRTPGGCFFSMYPNGEIVPKTVENTKVYLGEKNVEKYIELFGEVEEA